MSSLFSIHIVPNDIALYVADTQPLKTLIKVQNNYELVAVIT